MRQATGQAAPSGRVIYLACAIAFVAIVWVMFRGTWAPDLSAVYFGALSYSEGQYDLIYLSPDVFFGGSASDAWSARAAEFGHDGAPALPYVYAPIWAALLAPVAARLDPVAFYNAALVLHAVLCAAGVGLAYRIAAPQVSLARWSVLAFAVLLATGPTFTSFWLNQPQILVTFLILLAFERYRSGAMIAAGACLGLAAAVKIAPAALALIFVLDRRWKPLLVSMVVGMILLALSLLIAGPDLHRDFMLQLQKAGSYLIVSPLNYGAEAFLTSLGGIFERAPTSLSETSGFQIYTSEGWVVWAGAAGFLAVAAGLAFTRSGLTGRLIALWAALILFGPLGWSHYLIGPLLLFPAYLTGRAAPLALLALGLVSSPLSFVAGNAGAPVIVSIALGVAALLILIGLGLRGGGGGAGLTDYAAQN